MEKEVKVTEGFTVRTNTGIKALGILLIIVSFALMMVTIVALETLVVPMLLFIEIVVCGVLTTGKFMKKWIFDSNCLVIKGANALLKIIHYNQIGRAEQDGKKVRLYEVGKEEPVAVLQMNYKNMDKFLDLAEKQNWFNR